MADVTQIKTKMTKAEFLALPETMERIELIDGELIRQEDGVTAAKQPHRRIVGNTYFILRLKLTSGEVVIAPMDVHLDEQVLQPDVFWVSAEGSLCHEAVDGWYHGAPDLVVEVLSPSTRKADRGRKFKLYEQYGVRAYWLIEPDDQTVEVYQRQGDHLVLDNLYDRDQTFAFALLPDVTIPVADLFK